MRLSFSPFYFSVMVAAAAAGPWKAFSLDVKNGEIPSSSRRSLQKSSKKTGPVPRTSEPSPSPGAPAPTTPAPTPPPTPTTTFPPTVNPIFTVDCTDGGISDHTASLYDEPYPLVPIITEGIVTGMTQATVADTGITNLVPQGNDQLLYQFKGTAPRACLDDMVNHCAKMCDSASKCTTVEAFIFKADRQLGVPNPFDGEVFYCRLYNSNVPNLPLRVRGLDDLEDGGNGRVFVLKTAQVDQPLAVYTPSDAWEKKDVALINSESQWISPAFMCIATKSYTDFTANPTLQSSRITACATCLFTTINTIYYPSAQCGEIANFICERSDLNGVGLNTCASECFFDVGGPNVEICQNTVRVAFLALSGSKAVPCVMSDVYDNRKGYILANYTCPFMELPLGSPYPYFPRKELDPPTFAPTGTGTSNPTDTLHPTTTYYPTPSSWLGSCTSTDSCPDDKYCNFFNGLCETYGCIAISCPDKQFCTFDDGDAVCQYCPSEYSKCSTIYLSSKGVEECQDNCFSAGD